MSNKSKKEAVVNTRDDLEEHIAASSKRVERSSKFLQG